MIDRGPPNAAATAEQAAGHAAKVQWTRLVTGAFVSELMALSRRGAADRGPRMGPVPDAT